jgi:hypothetical protein
MKKVLLLLLCCLSFSQAFAGQKECKPKLADIICVVDPVDFNNPFATLYNRPCLSGGEKYIPIFKKHFEQSPKMIRKMYCSLEKIWIENSLPTTAHAAAITDNSNEMVAGAIGINRSFLESHLTIDKWMSLKDETSFGGSHDYASSGTGLITYSTHQKGKKDSAIFYAINHEFGHLFDYANKLNRYAEDGKPEKGSWGEISWLDMKTPRPEDQLQLPAELCFYLCQNEFLNPSEAKQLFNSLLKTGFQSTYATVNPKEDWAEAFALTLMSQEKGFTLKVKTSENEFDLAEHFRSDKLKEKREFVKKFMSSKLKYPAQ